MIFLLENKQEGRIRAGWRVSFFLIGLIITWILLALMKGYINEFSPDWLSNSIAYILTAFFFTLFVFVTGIVVDKRSFTSFGLYINKLWTKDLIAGIVIAGAVSILLYIIGLTQGWYDFVGFRFDREGIIFSLIGNIIMMACVAYYEELIFRGYLCLNIYEGFNKKYRAQHIPVLIAILTVSAFFGISHAINPNSTILGISNIILAGFMLSLPYFLTGNLGMVIGIHFAWNFFQGPLLGLPVSGIIFNNSLIHSTFTKDQLMNGAKFGIEGGLIGTIGILMILVLSWWYLRMRVPGLSIHPAIQSQSALISNRWGQHS